MSLFWKKAGPSSVYYCLPINDNSEVYNHLATIKSGKTNKSMHKVCVRESNIRLSPSGNYTFTSKLKEPIKKSFKTNQEAVDFVETFFKQELEIYKQCLR